MFCDYQGGYAKLVGTTLMRPLMIGIRKFQLSPRLDNFTPPTQRIITQSNSQRGVKFSCIIDDWCLFDDCPGLGCACLGNAEIPRSGSMEGITYERHTQPQHRSNATHRPSVTQLAAVAGVKLLLLLEFPVYKQCINKRFIFFDWYPPNATIHPLGLETCPSWQIHTQRTLLMRATINSLTK